MSAITGICECFVISGSASASSWLGTATRTIWQPVAVSSAICCSVASTSTVLVVVIDWTLTGASPPTATLPTWICRVIRRGARAMVPLLNADGVRDAGVQQNQRKADDHGKYSVGHRQDLHDVHATRVRAPAPP